MAIGRNRSYCARRAQLLAGDHLYSTQQAAINGSLSPSHAPFFTTRTRKPPDGPSKATSVGVFNSHLDVPTSTKFARNYVYARSVCTKEAVEFERRIDEAQVKQAV
ncbi:hypothetical protein T4D_11078 [Trichinella pseudospiralis]|uniref:Uncharacterized protein n=1 Tax=Trichinella pseudospiralis TaxID=6337 RepID=A0A0V1FMV1_TRIPS|nr:hypothetical protein T4D_11078 [Trichinella pseudospiralis]